MRRIILAASVALAASMAGCVNYDERIELNADGSGVVRMHLSIAEQLTGIQGSQKIEKEDDLLPGGSRQELIADIERQGFKVRSLRAESVQGLRHFYVVLEFKSLADVEKSELFGGRKVSLTRENGKMLFRSQIVVTEKTLTDRAESPAKTVEPAKPAPAPAPKASPPAKDAKKDAKKSDEPYVSIIKQLEMRFGRERVRQMFGAYAITFSVEMPGATLLRTNGANHLDAAAIWETPLDKLIEKWPTIAMDADFVPAATPAAPAPETPKP